MNEFEITCTTLTYGGQALGHLPDGRVVFVPFALPGETIRARLVKEKRGYAEAELLAVITPSPERIAPRCRHFMDCGGCHYQHMTYETQLAAKTQILRDQLTRLAGLADPPVEPAVPSPHPWYYRNHVQFHRAADGRLGFQAARSRQIVPITECHLPEERLNEVWLRGVKSHEERVSLRVGSDGRVQGADYTGPVTMKVLGRLFRVSDESFFQVNTAMAATMVQHVLAHLPLTPADTALDVYCGVGLFSAFLAAPTARLVGVESSPSACADFAANLAEFDRVELYTGTAEQALAALAGPITCLLVDPPRAGLGAAVTAHILRLAPANLVYISCDPATLARDARQLTAGGYHLMRITPFDLFPQTYHIESISFWERV
jgi:23S rRNA (uracil1939-C5)-methyltransferase